MQIANPVARMYVADRLVQFYAPPCDSCLWPDIAVFDLLAALGMSPPGAKEFVGSLLDGPGAPMMQSVMTPDGPVAVVSAPVGREIVDIFIERGRVPADVRYEFMAAVITVVDTGLGRTCSMEADHDA